MVTDTESAGFAAFVNWAAPLMKVGSLLPGTAARQLSRKNARGDLVRRMLRASSPEVEVACAMFSDLDPESDGPKSFWTQVVGTYALPLGSQFLAGWVIAACRYAKKGDLERLAMRGTASVSS
jgi:hypothetical protein